MSMSYFWEKFTDEELLDLELRELGLVLKDSFRAPLINQLLEELSKKNLKFKPHFWASDEWFSPEGIPGIAIPFFTLHPRLVRLERKMMGYCEGGTELSFMKLLRHECGHAIDHAFELKDRTERTKLFGPTHIAYPDSYTYKPYSRAYVRHIGEGYAQAHPEEDWAETFAVWLTPKSNWRVKYKGWKALDKLNCLNRLMGQIKGRKPVNKSKEVVDSLADSRLTLRKYYRIKTLSKRVQGRAFFGKKLKSLFSPVGKISGEKLLLTKKKLIIKRVARKTGLYQYEVEPMLKDLLKETRTTGLFVRPGKRRVESALSDLLVKESIRFKRQGRHRVIM
tara:strand:+ start:67465 stop:68472 length:1008 start_codon:yes stop_codon:yes gene_type:complete